MEDTTQRLQEAIEAARGGRLDEARSIAEELTGNDPDNAHAWFLRGILAEDDEQQFEYLNKTLAIDPEHKAARKRMAQIQPPVEEEDEPEVEEDQTMVADSAAFMGAVAAAEAVEEETVAEEAVADTMIAESPFAEEMLAEDAAVDELFAQEAVADAAVAEEEPAGFEDEDMATVIAAAAFLGEEEAPAEVADEPELEASDLVAAAAGAAILDQAGEAWFEEEADDELWSKVEAEAVPDWLIEDTSAEADETLAEALPPAEAATAQDQDLPDWLLDEPEDDWPEADELAEEAGADDEMPETVVAAAAVAAAADEVAGEDEMAEPAEDEEPAPAKPKKKSPNRTLEILLILLIVVALLVVAALVYFLVSPPSIF